MKIHFLPRCCITVDIKRVIVVYNETTGVAYSFSPPEKLVYTSFFPGKISIYSFFPPERSVYTHLSPWFLGGKSEYILKFPPHTQFSPFALIDYTRAITPIRGRPYGDFCRAFDAEEGRSPEPPWIRQWLSVNLFLRISTVYSTPRHNIISFKLNKLFCGSLFVCNRSF